MLERSTHSRRRAEFRRLRDQRLRDRRKAGRIVVPVEIDGEVLTLLIRTRWLLERDSTDARAIGEAIGAALAASALLERLADAGR